MKKIFAELQGNYGSRFLSQWQTNQRFAADHPRAGEDVGLVNAMAMWGKKLGGFADLHDAIRSVLDNLPDNPPTLPEFVGLCREAARRQGQKLDRLEHKPTPEEKALADAAAKRAREATSAMSMPRDPKQWARRINAQMLRGEAVLMQAEKMARDALRGEWEERAIKEAA